MALASAHHAAPAATLQRKQSDTAGEFADGAEETVIDHVVIQSDCEARNALNGADTVSLDDARETRSTTGGTNTRSTSKVLFLDGVRGMATLLVVTEHSGYWSGKDLGACAVDIFFVLSAFLLTWLFYKKSEQLIAQQASPRKWGYALADYFSKRFFRVYPLFLLVAVFLWLLPYESQRRYFNVTVEGSYDLFQVLTFSFEHRFHVFWTLPLEIAYYLLIPVFVLTMLRLDREWWVPVVPLTIWIVNAGLNGYREHHMPLEPHLPTFLTGSMGAVVYMKFDAAIRRANFEFPMHVRIAVRVLEAVVLALLLSVAFKGLLFHWVMANPAPRTRGSQCISMHVTLLIVVEMLLPSPLAALFEWNMLRFWGKISFSVYLLHSFVVYSPWLATQRDAFDKFFAAFFLIAALSTASYYLVERPSQVLADHISKALRARGDAVPLANYLPVVLATPPLQCEHVRVNSTSSAGSDNVGDIEVFLEK
ncbi:hypothetical protein PybrP1_012352 [[Pythium] brassicae (nom. inval.)]|nr:hypothetical protein PybrP1_012352 [[Pythium] brassicae (nom. inval.)]